MPMSPSTVRAMTRLASPDHTLRSAETRVTSSGTRYLPWQGPAARWMWLYPSAERRRGIDRVRSAGYRSDARPAHPDHGRILTRTARAPTGSAPAVADLPNGSAELLLDLRGLALDVLEPAAHEEGLLGRVVVVAVRDLRERLDRLAQRDERPLEPGEVLRHEGVLREEALDPPRPVDRDPVLLRELLDAEDRDDVLQLLVSLQDRLDPDGGVVVVLRDVARVEDPARGGERVHGGVDAQRCDGTAELRRRVEVRERRRGRRVRVVVGGHVHGLHRGDAVTAGRGDALLEHAHLVGQRRLVTDGARHAAEQRGHLRPRLREPEDVVDEQEHVLALHVAEVLRHRQRRQSDAQPGAGGLVHLPEDQRG